MSDVIGDDHADTIYWVDMNGMRAFSIKPRGHEKVLATYVKVPSASYVSDLEARLEKAEAERDACGSTILDLQVQVSAARNDALEQAAGEIEAANVNGLERRICCDGHMIRDLKDKS